MLTQPIEIKSSRNDHKIWGILWLPGTAEVKGVIQICHGMCEYIERYSDFAVYMCSQGYAVCGNDHIGHKNTANISSQPLGYFGGKNSWGNIIDDVELFRQHIQNSIPNKPWIMLGHSMGSFIARLYASKYGNNIDALIISGTGSKNPSIPLGKALAKTVSFFKGDRYISKIVDKMVSSSLNGKIKNPRTTADWICTDEKVVDKYLKDEYCTFTFSVSAYYDLFCLNDNCNKEATFALTPDNLPIYIFSGDKDPVGNMGKGPVKVGNLYKQNGKKNVTVKMYPNGRHEMLNETNKQQVYEDVKDWIEKTLQQ